MIKIRAVLVIVLLLTAVSSPISAWSQPSEESSAQYVIDEVMKEHGGTQTAWNEIQWNGGEITLTLDPSFSKSGARSARSAVSAASSCSKGKYCVYGSKEHAGTKLSFSSCPASNVSFGAIGSVRSIKTIAQTERSKLSVIPR